MILITGASGLVGRAVAENLLAHGQQVRLQARSRSSAAFSVPEGTTSSSYEISQLDFAQARQADFARLVDGCSAVIHAGALVHQPLAPGDQNALINTQSTIYLAQAAQKAALDTFAFISTSAVYGSRSFADVSEEEILQPETPYADSKAIAEQWLEQNKPAQRTIVLRPSLVFGEGDRGNMIALIKQINTGIYFHVAGNAARKSLIYSRDMATAIWLCLEALPAGHHVLNVANPQSIGVVELADSIARALGKKSPPMVPEALVRLGAGLAEKVLGERAPVTVSKLEKLQSTTTLSVNKLVQLTGFRPGFDLPDALGQEIAWARSSRLLPLIP